MLLCLVGGVVAPLRAGDALAPCSPFFAAGETHMHVLRWLLVLPFAIGAAVLVAFPIHWIVMKTLRGSWGGTIIEISDPTQVEAYAKCFFVPLAFIYVGAVTGPSQRTTLAYYLTPLPALAMLATIYVFRSSNGPIPFEEGLVSVTLNWMGCIAGFFAVRAHVRYQVSEAVVSAILSARKG